MIRAFLIFAGFLSITIALILIQPTAGLRAPGGDMETSNVTRSGSTLDNLTTATRGAAADASEDDPLSFGLMDTTPTAPVRTDNSVLASFTSTAAQQDQPQQHASAGLETMIVKALQQGQSQAYIDALVNDAAQRGKVEVPGELVTEDGRVDTGTLLSVLSGRTKPQVEGPQSGFYVVRTGDSLASIAYRFYGRTSYTDEIISANRTQLGQNGQLTVGQRLIMPAL
ncbi:LysM peptidoglycan-binding domain-containing protein [Pseudohalocynthiibacter aestuariivivens]|nr:LysM domain-containing protein [Pseudohalocynthiibacter aestuariivivens]QIE46632.1 LysM peptidoglycan-binding domain-containing protein [Pseudohalocynthiibacter aestuariivivens]